MVVGMIAARLAFMMVVVMMTGTRARLTFFLRRIRHFFRWHPLIEGFSYFNKCFGGDAFRVKVYDRHTSIGSLGDPTLATKEKGKVLVESVVADISEFIEDLKKK